MKTRAAFGLRQNKPNQTQFMPKVSNPISKAKKKAAARTYDAKAAELFGEYAALNFRGA